MLKAAKTGSPENPLFRQGPFRNGPKTRSEFEAVFLDFSFRAQRAKTLLFLKKTICFLMATGAFLT